MLLNLLFWEDADSTTTNKTLKPLKNVKYKKILYLKA